MRKMEGKQKMIVVSAIVLCVALVIMGAMAFGKHQMSKIPELTFRDVLEYTTRGNADAVISVGIIQDGQTSWQVYGENGRVLPPELHTYEIGSLTKTFTAALINKAILEKKISIDDTIDNHLSLPAGKAYPTIRELLTHTSGYKGFYFESPMISNFLAGRNDFCGITREMILKRTGRSNKAGGRFAYSNYGYAVLGLVLEAVCETEYTSLLNDFVQNELGLTSTRISDGSGDLGKYWDWKENDAYLSAGAITSTITDMLSYAKMQLEDHPSFSECHSSLKAISASSESNRLMGIHMDEIGMSWIIDSQNNIIWHNGGTGNYNSYLGFHPETGTAVVVLSNLAPQYRIPATIMGVKLLRELVEYPDVCLLIGVDFSQHPKYNRIKQT